MLLSELLNMIDYTLGMQCDSSAKSLFPSQNLAVLLYRQLACSLMVFNVSGHSNGAEYGD
jgi:hypothetical protein